MVNTYIHTYIHMYICRPNNNTLRAIRTLWIKYRYYIVY